MADYGVNIKLLIEGNEKIQDLKKKVKEVTKQTNALSQAAKKATDEFIRVTRLGTDGKGAFDPGFVGDQGKKLREFNKEMKIRAGHRKELIEFGKEEIIQEDEIYRKEYKRLKQSIKIANQTNKYDKSVRNLKGTFDTLSGAQQTAFKGLEEAFSFFKGNKDLEGMQNVNAELDSMLRLRNDIDKGYTNTAKDLNKIKNIQSKINDFARQGLNVSAAQEQLNKTKLNQDQIGFKIKDKELEQLQQELKLLAEQSKQLAKQNKLKQSARQKELKLLAEQNKLKQSARQKIGNAASSALIGGAFPLLFGQGPLSAVGGAIGGAAGGLIGGQAGFALSIAGTAIGTALQELTDALRKPEENIQLLISKLGLVGSPTEKTALALEKLGLKSTASRLLLDEFNARLGQSPREINENSKKLVEFTNKINLLGTELTLLLANHLGPFIQSIIDFGKKLNQDQRFRETKSDFRDAVEDKGGNYWDYRKKLRGFVDEAREEGRAKGLNYADRNELVISKMNAYMYGANNPLDQKNKPANNIVPSKLGKDLIEEVRYQKDIKPLENLLALEKQRFTLTSEQSKVVQEQNKLDKLNFDLKIKEIEITNSSDATELEAQKKKIEAEIELGEARLKNAEIMANPVTAALVQVQKEMDKLNDAQYRMVELSKSISSSFSESFKGIIKGTMSVQEAFANMFSRIADHFLDMAARIAAAQLQKGILTMFNLGSSIMSGPGGGYFDPMTGKGIAGPNYGLADGGTARGNQSYIVGERGPELFVPRTTGTVIPNHELGGGANIVVNVDASGSAVQGNAGQSEELGRMLAAAVQSELVNQ